MKNLIAFLLLIACSSSLFSQDECNNYWSAISPDGNYIYFSSNRHGAEFEIYRCDIDGTSNLMRLTNSPGINKVSPSVSPDGQLIVFQAGDYNSSSEIYIMNNDGSNLTRLTNNNVYDGYPNFSPDQTKIIFDAWDDSNYPEVFTMNLDGSGRTQITNESGAFWQSAPKYNPSGTKIYFSAGFNADNHYVMMDLDGSNWVDITPPNSFGYSDWGLQFNEDGSKIIFFTTDWVGYNNGADIVIADPDGSNLNKITNSTNGEYYYIAFFHPTNQKIYYSYLPNNSGNWSIHKMNLDGSETEKISNCFALNEAEISAKTINIFPNPTSGIIKMNFEGSYEIEVYNMLGKLILKSNDKLIDISGFAKGSYSIILKNSYGKVVHSEMIVKQ